MNVEQLRTRDVVVSELYRKVRDAAVCSEGATRAERIAVLELVKAELMRDALEAVHG